MHIVITYEGIVSSIHQVVVQFESGTLAVQTIESYYQDSNESEISSVQRRKKSIDGGSKVQWRKSDAHCHYVWGHRIVDISGVVQFESGTLAAQLSHIIKTVEVVQCWPIYLHVHESFLTPSILLLMCRMSDNNVPHLYCMSFIVLTTNYVSLPLFVPCWTPFIA